MLIDPITTTLLPAAVHLGFHSNCTPLPSSFKPFIKRVSTIATRPHRTISVLESTEKKEILNIYYCWGSFYEMYCCLMPASFSFCFNYFENLTRQMSTRLRDILPRTKLHHFNVSLITYLCLCVFQICGMVFTCCLHRRIKLDPY